MPLLPGALCPSPGPLTQMHLGRFPLSHMVHSLGLRPNSVRYLSPLNPSSCPSDSLGLTCSPSLISLDLVISRHINEMLRKRGREGTQALGEARSPRKQTLHFTISFYLSVFSLHSHSFQSPQNPQCLYGMKISYCVFSHSFHRLMNIYLLPRKTGCPIIFLCP